MFTFIIAFSVILSELMADPDPPVGLPPYEFAELYNVTDHRIDLTGWELRCGTRSWIFPPCSIASRSFLLVTSHEGADSWQPYGPVCALWTSGTVLANAGQTVTLFNAAGGLVAQVDYRPDWYRNTRKKDGGWSLEAMQLPDSPPPDESQPYIADAASWQASADPSGGTPGRKNSWDKSTWGLRASLSILPSSVAPRAGTGLPATIRYTLPEPDYRIQIAVFNRDGQWITDLAQDDIALAQGEVMWDGTDARHHPAPPGLYIVWLKAYREDGHVVVLKRPMVVL